MLQLRSDNEIDFVKTKFRDIKVKLRFYAFHFTGNDF